MLFVKYLIKKRSYAAGRNSGGRITCRHRGGSLTKRFVLPNLRRRIYDCLGEVLLIKRESVRSAFLALIYYRRFGIYEYILCAHKIKKGCYVISFNKTFDEYDRVWVNKYAKYFSNLGNSFFLRNLKIGALIFNVERFPGNGGFLVRAAGTVAKVVQKISFGKLGRIYVAIRLKSGKIFYLKGECRATLGQSSNPMHRKKSLKKAGVFRRLGHRPAVRGVAMNPVDHPHGGGEGKTSGGRVSVSLWGKLTKGKRTVANYKRVRLKKFLKRMRYGRSFK